MSDGGIDQAGDPRPVVAPPRDLLPLPLAIGLGTVLALGLFLYLNAHRLASHRSLTTTPAATAAPPPLLVPPPPLPAMAVIPAPLATITPAFPRPQPAPPMIAPVVRSLPAMAPVPGPARPAGPALVVDFTNGPGAALAATAGGAAAAEAGDDAARATVIRNRGTVIPQGAIIAAVLETPLNSDRPGLARAVVSHDARSFDGSRVLIPRGSRLIGEFKADPSPGLRRILVSWSRLIRPDGVAIRIDSPGADSLGGAGIGGRVNTHFGERFASAVLQSALAIGVNVASALPVSSNSTFYVGLPGQAQQLGQQLVPNTSRPPTVKVREGAEIAVFVARDLDFSGTPAVR